MKRAELESAVIQLQVTLAKIGMSATEYASFDKAYEFLVYDENYAGSRLVGLSYADWEEFRNAFPSPHRITVAITEADSVTTDRPVAEADFLQFIGRASSGVCRLEIRIDKERLCQKWGLEEPGSRAVVFFFTSALESILRQTLTKPVELERALWPDGVSQKLRIFLSDQNIHLAGSCFSVTGGDRLDAPIASTGMPPAAALERFVTQARERSRWEWPDAPGFLTPAHLRFDVFSAPRTALQDLLLSHRANLALLYLANRVREEDGIVVATISSAHKECRVRLVHETDQQVVSGLERIQALEDAVLAGYDERWGKDRLKMLQVLVVRDYASRRQPMRFNVITANALELAKDFDWQWTAFIEDKVEGFTAEASEFEKDVASTVESFDDQVSEMIKGLSATVIAAIGVTVAAVIAAVTKNSVSPTVISITLWLYAAYLITIPGILTVWLHLSRLSAIDALFKKRRERFTRVLSEENVERILSNHVVVAKQRFWLSLAANVLTLVIAIILCLVLAQNVDVIRQ